MQTDPIVSGDPWRVAEEMSQNGGSGVVYQCQGHYHRHDIEPVS